ncbi:MAG TPA: hypothetical protein VNI36_05080 [Candidatus Dormibacteraeota bacterium]|nr:hypothetical protein [Candidatus Dormibacteraeota bacterium]
MGPDPNFSNGEMNGIPIGMQFPVGGGLPGCTYGGGNCGGGIYGWTAQVGSANSGMIDLTGIFKIVSLVTEFLPQTQIRRQPAKSKPTPKTIRQIASCMVPELIDNTFGDDAHAGATIAVNVAAYLAIRGGWQALCEVGLSGFEPPGGWQSF